MRQLNNCYNFISFDFIQWKTTNHSKALSHLKHYNIKYIEIYLPCQNNRKLFILISNPVF